MKKRVIIYVRVSTDEQADKGLSIPAQIAKIKSFCAMRGWEIIMIFEEDYTAWKGFERPAYIQLKEYLKQNKGTVDYILFTQWSRFSRLLPASYNEIYKLKDLNIEVNAVEQWINFSIPENLFMLSIYLTGSQVENERLSMRVKVAIREGLKQGRWMSKAPFGYFNEIVSKMIYPDPEKSKIIQFYFEKFSEGIYSAEEVRRMAKDKGLTLTKQSFLNSLTNPFYIGKIIVPKLNDEPMQLVNGLHEAIITNQVFEKVQTILQGKRKPYSGKTSNDNLPLRGSLICAKCGEVMTGSGSRSRNGSIIHYYHGQRNKANKNSICNISFNAKKANEAFEKFLDSFVPKPEILNLYSQMLKEKFSTETDNIDKQKLKIESQIEEINKKLLFLNEKWIDGVLKDNTFNKMTTKFEEEQSNLIMQHATLKQMPTEYEKYIKYGFSLLSNVMVYYKEASTSTKKKLLGSLFPEKLIIENNEYRTTNMNALLTLIFNSNKALVKKKPTSLSARPFWLPLLDLNQRPSD